MFAPQSRANVEKKVGGVGGVGRRVERETQITGSHKVTELDLL